MSFPFNSDIPAAPNNPSDDQPQMLSNNVTHRNIWGVDHISFDNNNAGKHTQITFEGENPASAPINPESVSYTDVQSGSAFTNSQIYFRNEDSPYLLNAIRAFGSVTIGGVTPTLNNTYNVASVSGNLLSVTIVLNSNVVVGNDVIILPFMKSINPLNANKRANIFSFTNPNLELRRGTGSPFSPWVIGDIIYFVVLQA